MFILLQLAVTFEYASNMLFEQALVETALAAEKPDTHLCIGSESLQSMQSFFFE